MELEFDLANQRGGLGWAIAGLVSCSCCANRGVASTGSISWQGQESARVADVPGLIGQRAGRGPDGAFHPLWISEQSTGSHHQ